MNAPRRAALVSLTAGLLFVALEEATGVRLGLAGLYVVGMASGIWIGEVMTREAILEHDEGGTHADA